jgi:hypothetical protein
MKCGAWLVGLAAVIAQSGCGTFHNHTPPDGQVEADEEAVGREGLSRQDRVGRVVVEGTSKPIRPLLPDEGAAPVPAVD